jgi:glyoxylase-like metal-dependent hydrolase (beta-lactamase superfamily II)
MTSRRRVLALGASLFLLPRALRAERAQVAGIYRRRVGDLTVTALLDGYIPIDPAMMQGADDATKARLIAEAFQTAPVENPINAFVIERGERAMLVDGGAGAAFGPTAGGLAALLPLAGVDPARIDTLFCTHLHGDHVGAFATADGKPAFPDARLVLNEAERAFWTADATLAGADEAMKPFVLMARAALPPYADRTETVGDGAEVFPGVTAVHLPGHTPGHTGLMLSDGGGGLLIWADVVHMAAVQFAMPSVTIPFDSDQPQAAATRARLFDRVATDGLEIAGSHIGFPGLGHVTREGGAYRFQPSPWDHTL